ncbi:hypothetical protein IWQ60_009337 [Tieghemiomyces parasiticus]|uniref:Palmitoyl-protein thioesterase 1 n=1 Tax=Tieghemiomyces parasiticus TaxID=78921 RepID=A0A9W7ZPH8_9FUNG|nr:hypothetical protein IWQ60_009337 [Tieghemiomyces parasiticus]
MRLPAFILTALVLGAVTLAATVPAPVVVWHGMGDSAYSKDSMGALQRSLETALPGAYIHLVALGGDQNSDVTASFWGNVNNQVDTVCRDLQRLPQLRTGFHALGFSQGGLFLRAYVERCNTPPVRNLVTLGSPHGGIAAPPDCSDERDTWSCHTVMNQLRRRAYAWYFRDHVVQAQYYKDPQRLDEYYEYNVFLPAINNEITPTHEVYRDRLRSLNRFVMVRYENDSMIVPPTTAWFASIEKDATVPLRETDGYRKDVLGLRTLDEQQRLVFLSFPGEHLQHNATLFDRDVLPHLATPIDSVLIADTWWNWSEALFEWLVL